RSVLRQCGQRRLRLSGLDPHSDAARSLADLDGGRRVGIARGVAAGFGKMNVLSAVANHLSSPRKRGSSPRPDACGSPLSQGDKQGQWMPLEREDIAKRLAAVGYVADRDLATAL